MTGDALDKPAAPVEVTNQEPIPVVIGTASTTATDAASAMAAKAAVDSDVLTRQDQRRISGIWERTQQIIALSVVLIALVVSGFLAVARETDASFVFLSSVANLVIGFYFGRTNHTRVGGSGEASR